MPATAPTKPKILRRGEAAERLGIHPNTLAGWIKRGWADGRHDAERRGAVPRRGSRRSA